ncbi:TPA: 50S ribosomal protein L17 [Patescibacteria group bacterium]|nr:50S ribosomal protein L17 [Candidatus Gracilibacteria bacterium]HBY74518.1 50S ribosomal protein L17 [Candidatus Gracilibacteria bacterium]
MTSILIILINLIMRHRVKQIRRLNHKDPDHRDAVLRNLMTSFFVHKSITTTAKRAKNVQIITDRLVNLVNTKDKMNAIREVARYVFTKESSIELFSNIAPKYSERKSGITRITPIKLRV